MDLNYMHRKSKGKIIIVYYTYLYLNNLSMIYLQQALIIIGNQNFDHKNYHISQKARLKMEQVSLTSHEKNKIENEKQIYVLLRLIHCVQKYYSYDRIDKNTYETQINRLLEKYKRFSQMIPNHNLDAFCKTFNIPNQQISWARLVLQKGVSTQEQQNKGGYLFVQATASFIEVLDSMTSNVGQSKNMLESLQTVLAKLCSRLRSPEFSEKFRSFQTLLQNYVFSRGINESMTESEFQQIRLTVQGLYMMMGHLVKN